MKKVYAWLTSLGCRCTSPKARGVTADRAGRGARLLHLSGGTAGYECACDNVSTGIGGHLQVQSHPA